MDFTDLTFNEKLHSSLRDAGSPLVVGLDPDPARMPLHLIDRHPDVNDLVTAFCHEVIDATRDHACGYKLNLAFFEALGRQAFSVFADVVNAIPKNRLVVADAKRGDIGNTAGKYRDAFFGQFGVDAVTLSPFMGLETMASFLEDDRYGVFALTLTSNPGSADLMEQKLEGGKTVSVHLAESFRRMQKTVPGTLGMVVGATKAGKLRSVLEANPEAPLLIPGIGAQGGSIDELARALQTHHGPALIPISRDIIYASIGLSWKEDVAGRAAWYKKQLSGLIV
ncbi:MAG: orotidine-5'-phosphate decarboxylase [Cyclonatronaceae bacterium]